MRAEYLRAELVPRKGARYREMSRDEMAAMADSLKWFHAIDCGDFQTSGRFRPGSPQNATLYAAFDLLQSMNLSLATCLDIGTADGLLAFGMKALDAKEVVAVDTFANRGFLLMRAAVGADVTYFPELQIKDLLDTFRPASFDLVVCAGVIYHMLNPLSAFTVARQLVKEGGLFLVEGATTLASSDPVMYLNPASATVPERFTYWVPTPAAIEGMMRLACFDVVATRLTSSPDRFTALGRACRPDAVGGRGPLLRRMHESDFCDHEFGIEALFAEPRASAEIPLRPVAAHEEIAPAAWRGSFPFHPRAFSNVKGRSRWSEPEGNR